MKNVIFTMVMVASMVVVSSAIGAIDPNPPGSPKPVELESSNPKDGAVGVKLEEVNEGGIEFVFTDEVKFVGVIVETNKGRVNFDIPDFVNSPSKVITIMPVSEDDELTHGMQVSVEIMVKDKFENKVTAKIGFSMIIDPSPPNIK